MDVGGLEEFAQSFLFKKKEKFKFFYFQFRTGNPTPLLR